MWELAAGGVVCVGGGVPPSIPPPLNYTYNCCCLFLFFRLGDPVALAAPTGLAAHNIRGTTLHSMFKMFPAKPGLKEQWKSLDRGQIKEMKNPNLKLLIVDEVL